MQNRMQEFFKQDRQWKRSTRIVYAQAQLKAAKGNEEETKFWKAVLETYKRPKYFDVEDTNQAYEK